MMPTGSKTHARREVRVPSLSVKVKRVQVKRDVFQAAPVLVFWCAPFPQRPARRSMQFYSSRVVVEKKRKGTNEGTMEKKSTKKIWTVGNDSFLWIEPVSAGFFF